MLMNTKISPHKAWAKTQSKTMDHRIAVLLYSIICGLIVIKPNIAFWGPFIFFIITALTKMGDMLSYMIFSMIVTTIASLINPVLGFIVSAIFLLMKISNFIKNWKAIVAGVLIYLLPSLLLYKIGYYLIYPVDHLLYTSDVSYQLVQLINILIIGGFGGLILHITLNWLYKNEYSSKSALATMGSAPLIILLLIIPFIINAVGNFIDDIINAGGMADDFISFKDGYNHESYTQFETIDLDGDGINDNIHQVRGHYRSTPSGGVTYVDPHIRTNPNAIVSDNISHNR